MRAHGVIARLIAFCAATAMCAQLARAQPAPQDEPKPPRIYAPQELFHAPYAFCRAGDKAIVVTYLRYDKTAMDAQAQQARDYDRKMRLYIQELRTRKAVDAADKLEAVRARFEEFELPRATVEFPNTADEQLDLAEAAKVVDCDPAEIAFRRPVIEAVALPELPDRFCSNAEKAKLLARIDEAIAAAKKNYDVTGDYLEFVKQLRPPYSLGREFVDAGPDLKKIPGVDISAAEAERARVSAALVAERGIASDMWRRALDALAAADKLRARADAMKPVACEPPAGAPVPPPEPPHFPVPERPTLPSATIPLTPMLCTELERNDYLAKTVDPAVTLANANSNAAKAHLERLEKMRVDAVAARASFDEIKALSEETTAYRAIANDKYEIATGLLKEREIIAKQPLDDCTKPFKPTATPQSPRPGLPGGPAKTICPPESSKRKGRAPIKVGSNAKVGSGARAAKKAIGMLGGMVGGMLGGGGGGGGGGGPQLATCRIKDSEKTVFTDPASGISLRVGAKHAGNTLVVFADVLKSPDSGTFQGGWIEKPDGNLMAPKKADICELWGEWSLTVSWTQTTYVDGVKTSESSGGYSDGGAFNLPGMISTDDAPAGLWKQLGFSNASHGAREVALQYPLPPGGLTDNPLHLLIHVTRPSGNPVMTQPFDLVLNEGPKGVTITRAPEIDLNPGTAREPCVDAPAEPMSPTDKLLNRALGGANPRDPGAVADALLKRYPEDADRDRREGQGLPYSPAPGPAQTPVPPPPPPNPAGEPPKDPLSPR